jgi:hypothetical protein
MPELTLNEIRAITELAKVLYSFLPGKAHQLSKPKVDFGTVAGDTGIGNLWPGGSKLPAIQTLLESTLGTRREKFCPLMIRITKEGLKYRSKKGNPITQEEMTRLNKSIVGVGFKIPELVDPNFNSSLPKSKSNLDDGRKKEEKINFEKIKDLKQRFGQIEKLEPHQRGYELESFLYDLFYMHGFNPRQPFKIKGEQIDGSIELDNQVYLIEAKWQTLPIQERDLLPLQDRASGHCAFGRGIFITCGCFSQDGVYAFQRLHAASIIGIDGQDLYFILENSLPLADVIRLKNRRRVETGEFHYPVLKLIPEIINAKRK